MRATIAPATAPAAADRCRRTTASPPGATPAERCCRAGCRRARRSRNRPDHDPSCIVRGPMKVTSPPPPARFDCPTSPCWCAPDRHRHRQLADVPHGDRWRGLHHRRLAGQRLGPVLRPGDRPRRLDPAGLRSGVGAQRIGRPAGRRLRRRGSCPELCRPARLLAGPARRRAAADLLPPLPRGVAGPGLLHLRADPRPWGSG